MKKRLELKNRFWTIEVNEDNASHTITEGEVGSKGTSQTTKFDEAQDAFEDARKRIRNQREKGYETFISVPEGLFLERTFDFGSGPYVPIDLDDKARLIQVLDGTLQWIKDYIEGGNLKQYHCNPQVEPIFLIKQTDKEAKFPYLDYRMDLFSQILDRYPDLEEKAIEWLDYFIECGGVCLDDEAKYLGHEIIQTLVNRDKKHIKKLIAFLHTNDMNHETEVQEDFFEELPEKYGLCEETMELIAARRHSLCGQHGSEFELGEFLDEGDANTNDRFFQFFLLDLYMDNDGKPNKKLADPTAKWRHEEVKKKMDYYVSDVLNELGISFDSERMVMAIANLDLENPHKLSDILNPDYEIPLNKETCESFGHQYTKEKKYEKSIEFFTKAVELDPTDNGTYLGRGYAYYCNGEIKKAEADWLKSVELFPDGYQGNLNLAVTYKSDLPDYPKALKHINKVIGLRKIVKPSLYLDRGSIYELMGESEKAQVDLQKGLETGGEKEWIYYAQIQTTSHNFDKVIQNLEGKKFKDDGYEILSWFFRAVSQLSLGKNNDNEIDLMMKHLDYGEPKIKWNFDEFKTWIPQAKLNENQQAAINRLLKIIEDTK